MIVLEPDSPPFLVGVLPPVIDHPLLCDARPVYLAYSAFVHIHERRTQAEVEFVLRHLTNVVSTPTHIGLLKSERRRVDIFSHVPQNLTSGVCVGLKCLDGETWINTAFPMGVRTLLKYVRANRMQPVPTEPY